MRPIVFVLLLACLSCSNKPKAQITIATAANVQFAMDQLVKSFEEQTGISCAIILGSSGQLNAQIKSGAPFDVFVSANLKYPQDVYESQMTLSEPKIYAYGILVLCSRNKSLTIHDLLSDSIRKIAIANPSTAPYGEAALEVLKKSDIKDEVEDKLVFGESISQVNRFILSNAVDVGFTSKSIVVSVEFSSQCKWIEVDSNLYSPIAQGIAVLKGKHEKESKQFYDFMFSSEGKKILQSNGYRVD